MATFVRLLGFLKPFKRGVAASVIFASGAMAMTVLIPWLVGRAVNEISLDNSRLLWPYAIAILAAGVLRLGLSVVRRLISGHVSLGIEYDLRNRLYSHLQELELGFYDVRQTGQLMSRATVDLQSIRFFLGYGLTFIVQNLLTVLLSGAVMFAISPLLAAAALSPVPLIVWAAARFGRSSRPAQQEVQQRLAEVSAAVEENVSGVRVVKAFAREPFQLRKFKASSDRLLGDSMVVTKLKARYGSLIAFLPNIGLALILVLGGRMVIDSAISLGDFVAFYAYLTMLLAPVRMLGMALGTAQRAVASGNRMFEILDRRPRIESKPGAGPLPPGRGRVEFDDVTFAYGTGAPTLSDIDLEIPAGTTVALVGASGSGKTTLALLVARLYDVRMGAVRIDGTDIRDVDTGLLRREIALVTDDAFLFSATIAENIAYAKPDASRAEIETAARRAQIHEFITTLPHGYETPVGERGLTLSGGQRQRMAIARAILVDPRILILDDATSSLDARTESALRDALTEVMKDRTTLIVAHRPSSVALASVVVLLENGRVADCGTPAELEEESPRYREVMGLWSRAAFIGECQTAEEAAERL